MIASGDLICLLPEYARPADWWKAAEIAYKDGGNEAKLDDEYIDHVEQEFNILAERWQQESAIHSSPVQAYLHRDYIAVIGMGIRNPRAIVPLILKRIQTKGGDWFFALETIANTNVAKDSEDFEDAVTKWIHWAQENDFMGEGDALRAA